MDDAQSYTTSIVVGPIVAHVARAAEKGGGGGGGQKGQFAPGPLCKGGPTPKYRGIALKFTGKRSARLSPCSRE